MKPLLNLLNAVLTQTTSMLLLWDQYLMFGLIALRKCNTFLENLRSDISLRFTPLRRHRFNKTLCSELQIKLSSCCNVSRDTTVFRI